MDGRGGLDDLVDLGLGGSGSSGGGRIPVFVFPSSLIFSANEREHIKQILTIYNPYDFPLLFRVLSTTPNLFNVVEPEGSIQTKSAVDLIIRLTSSVPVVSTEPIESKFRVQVYHFTTKQALGRKDILTTIVYGSLHHHHSPHLDSDHGLGLGSTSSTLSGQVGQGQSSDVFLPTGQHHLGQGQSTSGSRTLRHRTNIEAQVPVGGPQINYVAIVTGLVCILGLMLPSEKDDPGSTIIPSYLHLSVNQKLLVAYTLGLVTMVIFRP